MSKIESTCHLTLLTFSGLYGFRTLEAQTILEVGLER